jgi:hypothetical protein
MAEDAITTTEEEYDDMIVEEATAWGQWWGSGG